MSPDVFKDKRLSKREMPPSSGESPFAGTKRPSDSPWLNRNASWTPSCCSKGYHAPPTNTPVLEKMPIQIPSSEVKCLWIGMSDPAVVLWVGEVRDGLTEGEGWETKTGVARMGPSAA